MGHRNKPFPARPVSVAVGSPQEETEELCRCLQKSEIWIKCKSYQQELLDVRGGF